MLMFARKRNKYRNQRDKGIIKPTSDECKLYLGIIMKKGN